MSGQFHREIEMFTILVLKMIRRNSKAKFYTRTALIRYPLIQFSILHIKSLFKE